MSELFENLESRRLMAGEHPVAIGFNDEALWNENFQTAVSEAKKVGATAVRLWFGIASYDDRPSPTDVDRPWQDVAAERGLTYSVSNGMVIRRAFELSGLGFKVMLTLQKSDGQPPATAAQATSFFSYLKNIKSPTATTTLADAVEYWEIGNEPDLGHYWVPSTTDKVTGIKAYVDQLLIPAAEGLKSGTPNEKVVSAGVSWKPEDLSNLLNQVKTRNKLGLIDYAGYHPYGRFDPDGTLNEQKDRVIAAAAVGVSFGKQLIATEWNIRGYPTDGTQNAKWARAIDQNFRNVIAPNFHSAYYYTLANNFALRGGTVSGRPAGLLKHDSPLTNVATKTLPEIEAWMKTPLVPSEPFYSVYSQWQYGSIAGTVRSAAGTGLSGRNVFIDMNGDGFFQFNEPSTTSGASGTYKLTYSSGSIPAGPQTIYVESTSDFELRDPAVATLGALKSQSGVDFIMDPVVAPPDPKGNLTGRAWDDTDGDGVLDAGEAGLSNRRVYLDVDGDTVYDATEPSTLSTADGTFTLNYDTSVTPTGGYALRQVLPTGWQSTTPIKVLAVVPGGSGSGNLIGSQPIPVPPGETAGSVSGQVFDDTNGDGIKGTSEVGIANRRIYIDRSRDGAYQTGEPAALTLADGSFKITFDTTTTAAGTYNLRQVTPTGWANTTGGNFVVVAGASNVTGILLGSRQVTTPTNQGRISGYLFNDSNGNGVQDGSETRTGSRTVFLDLDGDRKLDASERRVSSDAQGNYYFDVLAAGTYYVTREFPTGYRLSTGSGGAVVVNLATDQQVTTANIGTTNATVTPPTLGRIGGTLFNDGNANGLFDSNETVSGVRTVYLDANRNGILDAGEKQTQSTAAGVYSFTGLAAGTYYLSRAFPSGYRMSTSTVNYMTITLTAGQMLDNVLIGTTDKPR